MEKKRLTKSRKDKKLFGVCSGIANYLDCDPTIVRLIWAGSIIFLGVGVIGYIAAALIIPEDENI